MNRINLLLTLALLAPCGRAGIVNRDMHPTPTTVPAQPTVDDVIANVRKAIGYEQLKKHKGGVLIEGTLKRYSAGNTYSLMFKPGGQFVSRTEGPFNWIIGFDGTDGWTIDWSGTPYVHEQNDHTFGQSQLRIWLGIGRWLDEQEDIELSILNDRTDERRVVLSAKLKRGEAKLWLVIDRSTWLPTAICEPERPNSPLAQFEDYRWAMGFCFPHRTIGEGSAPSRSISQVHSIRKSPCSKRNLYTLVANMVNDTRFNPDRPPQVELRLAKTGHLLVHPRIVGQDAGWFMLDSGANILFIDPGVADEVSMPIVFDAQSGAATVGIPGEKKSGLAVRKAREIGLGPMTISELICFPISLDVLSWFGGPKIAGVFGYDIFRRAVIELDISNTTLKIHDPETFLREDVNWQGFVYDNRLICIRCKFDGDREALFMIDTGSNGTISFNAPAVKQFNLIDLIDGSKKSRLWSRNMPGTLFGATASHKGSLPWFEIGGHRIENVEATFAPPAPDDTPYSDTSPAGSIGLGLLRRFKVIFDYPHKRIAFIKPAHADTPGGTDAGADRDTDAKAEAGADRNADTGAAATSRPAQAPGATGGSSACRQGRSAGVLCGIARQIALAASCQRHPARRTKPKQSSP